MTISQNINRLLAYGVNNNLIDEADIIYTTNKLLELFKLDGLEEDEISTSPINSVPFDRKSVESEDLENILNEMLDYASKNNIFEDSGIVSRDLFDTKIMGLLLPPPSSVRNRFYELKNNESAKKATDWYYKFSCDSDYIRRYRVCKDLKWQTDTKYGKLDITINLSKPEKDPKAIAAALKTKQGGYPKCLLCKENEGYAGRLNHAARQNHRIIPIKLNNEDWFLQYSPYVYYNEHCIVFDSKHEPMKICRDTFSRLLDFVQDFPHYTLGSNADIPIVGGSILTHNHFQGGQYSFPMEKAPVEKDFSLKNFQDVKAGIVKWPMSVIRISSDDKNSLIDAAEYILNTWKSYTDKEAFVFAETEGINHNTITPIARKRDNKFELDLVLRNNITTEEQPLGVFHPHANLHHIKKENIGLIEVMGLAVLPSRLKTEIQELEAALNEGKDISADENLAKHSDWIKEVQQKHKKIDENILKNEIGLVFEQVLEDAGVFKNNEQGRIFFDRFINIL